MLLLIASGDNIQNSLEDAYVIYIDAGRLKLILLYLLKNICEDKCFGII